MTPLLSICIPTRNRASLLEPMLRLLLPEARELDGAVEVVVSDNASDDETPQILESLEAFGPLRVHRNARNRGAVRNILQVIELAHGEYCMLLGDDDMILAGGLGRLVSIVDDNSQLDGFYLNFYPVPVEHREFILHERSGAWADPEEGSIDAWCRDTRSRPVERWEDIFAINARAPEETFLAFAAQIFRRSTWLSNANRLDLSETRFLGSFDTSFPHTKVLAYALTGKPAFYVGEPLVVAAHGSQKWESWIPATVATRILEALDLYEHLGVDRGFIRDTRRRFLNTRGFQVALYVVLFGKDVPGREHFSLSAFLWRNRSDWRDVTRILAKIIDHRLRARHRAVSAAQRLPGPVYRALRAVYRAMRALAHVVRARTRT
jgi:glycosyltransferase involved in cell wall biosynthesis